MFTSMFERIVFGVMILAAAGIVLLIPFSIMQHDKWATACKDAGGVPYSGYKSESLCLNPSAIIEVK